MATLLLTAVGTAIGGPIGGALGAFVGRQADQEIFGGGTRAGPRLKELSVTTSSYGQPIARTFGRMRMPGTIIWSTNLKESRTTQGGAKGQPSTASFTYSASFAVAISSAPIERIGRIWADGDLLRGAAGDLKVAGEMRVHRGTGDAQVDPLIAADRGMLAPAFRDCAYVVFEDLALADFGNRIPALTFEVVAAEEEEVSIGQLLPDSFPGRQKEVLSQAHGFSDEGGPIGSTLAALDQVYPLVCRMQAGRVDVAAAYSTPETILTLPQQLVPIRDDDANERHRKRGARVGHKPLALRYYDEERDYQPSVQRALGKRPLGREHIVDLPAAMNAGGARELANGNAQRARWQNEQVIWRIGELDTQTLPGSIVRLPDMSGLWLVRSWEWFDRGIELGLERIPPELASNVPGDAGAALVPGDHIATPTVLFASEIPAFDGANSASPSLVAAATSAGLGWRGAALFAERGTTLEPIGAAGKERAVAGYLAEPLESAPSALFMPQATLVIDLPAADLSFSPSDITALSMGINRLMVGGELLQFARCNRLGETRWELRGLLRGRAGTEDAASLGHDAGTAAILLDDATMALDPTQLAPALTMRIAAIGLADDEPVFAEIHNAGLSRRPPMPVAPRLRQTGSASQWSWTRRARGYWRWIDGAEVPLVEDSESYLVGFGSGDTPHAAWTVATASFALADTDRAALLAEHGAGPLWVRQSGTFGLSSPLLLASLA